MADLPSYDSLMNAKKEEPASKPSEGSSLPSYDDLIKKGEPVKEFDLKEAVGNIPLVGGPAKFALENREAINNGLLQGVTGGFSDELEGALKGAGSTALEGMKGTIPEEQSAMDRLKENYAKYKELAHQSDAKSQDANFATPVLHAGGEMAGNALLAEGALTKSAATLPGRLGAMAGLGALEGAGKSEGSLQDNPEKLKSDMTTGGALGLLGGGLAEGAAPLISKAAGGLIKYGQGNEYMKQLAATLQNASEGGTLFSQQGKQKVAQKMEDFASKSADDIVKNLPEKNKLYEDAFKQASEAGNTIEPNSSLLQSESEAMGKLQNASIKLPPTAMQSLQKLQSGGLDPQEAYSLIRQLNELKFNKTAPKTPEYESLSNFADELTQATNGTLPSTTLENLNLQKSTAHKAVEPFLQGAGTAEFEPNKFTNQSSQYSQNELRSKIKDYFGSNLERVGEGTAKGTDYQNQLSKGKDYFQGLQEKAPLSTDFNKILDDTQQLGYLNTARRTTSGIHTESGKPLDKLGQVFNSVMSSPYRAAEAISSSSTAQDVSKALLMGNKDMTKSVTERLMANPTTKHLGESLANPRNQTHLNQTIFTIMQNPTAKETMGIGPEDEKK